MNGTDFFRARLDTEIDLRRPLVVLSTRLPWLEIESNLAPVLAHKNRPGCKVEGVDLFGPAVVCGEYGGRQEG